MPIVLNGSGTITGLSALPKSAMAVGSIIQTVSTTFAPYGDNGSERGDSTTYSDTGIVLSITPTVNTSKILVLTDGGSFGYKTSDSQVDYYINLVATPSGGSSTQLRETQIRHTVANNTTQRHHDSWSLSGLHDHNGTVAVEYKVQHKHGVACTYCWARYKGATLTLMEIAV